MVICLPVKRKRLLKGAISSILLQIIRKKERPSASLLQIGTVFDQVLDHVEILVDDGNVQTGFTWKSRTIDVYRGDNMQGSNCFVFYLYFGCNCKEIFRNTQNPLHLSPCQD